MRSVVWTHNNTRRREHAHNITFINLALLNMWRFASCLNSCHSRNRSTARTLPWNSVEDYTGISHPWHWQTLSGNGSSAALQQTVRRERNSWVIQAEAREMTIFVGRRQRDLANYRLVHVVCTIIRKSSLTSLITRISSAFFSIYVIRK